MKRDGRNVVQAGVLVALLIVVLVTSVGRAQPEILWVKTYNMGHDETCTNHIQTSDGGYLLVGVMFGTGGPILIIKTDPEGDSLWSKIYNPYHLIRDPRVIETPDSGFAIFTTNIVSGVGRFQRMNFSFLRLDKNGDSLWINSYGQAWQYGVRRQNIVDTFGQKAKEWF